LHLSLGIFDRIWTLLEEGCTELDLKLAESSSGSDFGGSKFREALARKSLLLSELDRQKTYTTLLDQMTTYLCLTLPDAQTSSFLQELKKEAETAHNILSDKVQVVIIYRSFYLFLCSQSKELSKLDTEIRKKFEPGDGPFFSTLEKSLQHLNVKRQAYQGGTFIGNHVHKLLKVSQCELTSHNIITSSVSNSPTASKLCVATSPKLHRTMLVSKSMQRKWTGNSLSFCSSFPSATLDTIRPCTWTTVKSRS